MSAKPLQKKAPVTAAPKSLPLAPGKVPREKAPAPNFVKVSRNSPVPASSGALGSDTAKSGGPPCGASGNSRA